MNQLPTNVQWIENTVGHSLELLHMNTKSIKPSETRTILPVYNIDIFYIWDIIQGSYTKELFKFVRTKVLPCCTPYSGPFCNARFHHPEGCRFTNGSRSLGLVGFAASRNQADARHYDLLYLYNPQQVAS